MSYIGRKGQTAPLASADLPTNSISTAHLINDAVTSAKIGVDVIVAEDIAANAVTVAEIADDAVTQAKLADDAVGTDELANDVVINTSGAITTTGAFTSVGIDDNASGATAITIDANENVGIGTNSPASYYSGYDNLVVASSGHTGITVVAGTANISALAFADGTSGQSRYEGHIQYDHNANKLYMGTAGSNNWTMDASGNVGMGDDSPSAKLVVSGSATSYIKMDVSTASYPKLNLLDASIELDDTTTPTLPLNIKARNPGNASYTSPITFWTGAGGGSLTQKMIIAGNGNVGIGLSAPLYPLDVKSTGTASYILAKFNGTGTGDSEFTIQACDDKGYASNDTCLKVPKQSGRSINAGGTINASGADYAEYETKRDDCSDIAKGDIVGFDIDGLLTDKWNLAITFGVKSTNPSYVGGDTWSSVDDIGNKPERINFEDDNSFEVALSEWNTELSNLQVKVDRIGYSGKVPVNISSGEVGDYVIPVQDVEGIKGEAVTTPTIEQYTKAVGQIRTIKDGVYTLALKMG